MCCTETLTRTMTPKTGILIFLPFYRRVNPQVNFFPFCPAGRMNGSGWSGGHLLQLVRKAFRHFVRNLPAASVFYCNRSRRMSDALHSIFKASLSLNQLLLINLKIKKGINVSELGCRCNLTEYTCINTHPLLPDSYPKRGMLGQAPP